MMGRGGGGMDGGMTSAGGSFQSGSSTPGVVSMLGRAGSSTIGTATGSGPKDLSHALSFLGGHKRAVIPSYAAWVVANVLDLMIPLQIRWAIDSGIGTPVQGQPGVFTGNPGILTVAVLTMAGLYIFKSG